ncbi:MAG: porin [Cyclobacteriaceae bacterium]
MLFASSDPDGTKTNKKDWDKITQQEVDHSYKPLTLKLSEDGSKYLRLIMWHQVWVQTNNLSIENTKTNVSTSLRRSRVLAFAQISPRFLILTHWGLNSLNTGNMTSLGNNGDSPQLFLHGAWTEFKLSRGNQIYVGAGLHYWKGLTRLASQSTLNFMTMDNTRPFVHWHSLGITDQFARHLGVYFKGELGKFDYRMAINNPMNANNSLGAGQDFGGKTDLIYAGSNNLEGNNLVGNTIIEGYFRYNVFDTESPKLPHNVGTYLGAKKILAFGLGFFAHPSGMFNTSTNEHSNITHVAGDIFLDMPIGNKGNAMNAYASVINFNYGDDFMSRWAGTGTNLYGHLGYYVDKIKLMPYLAFQSGNYDAFDDNLNALDFGVNYFVNGHHAKITAEYHTISNNPLEGGVNASGVPNGTRQFRLQLHVFL